MFLGERALIESLIPKGDFVGLESVTHLATGGESPMLKSHLDVVHQFMIDKACGEASREKQAAVMDAARNKCARLFSVDASDITFLSNASEGINNVAYGLDWQSGDNVVVADVEFPSDILPWTRLADRGVELRVVKHRNWQISLQDIADQMDSRTRVVAVSHVSMFTGQRIDLPALSNMVRSSNALLLLDATHSAGVVPVDARYADIMVSSCYKWLLATHGAAVFYCNSERLPDFQPPFLGWNNVAVHGGWKNPTQFKVLESADRFLPGNPGFISIYILNNALEYLLGLGAEQIEAHSLALCDLLLAGVMDLGWEIMTPFADQQRAGNVCFMASDITGLSNALEAQGVLIWGAYANFGRLRISAHVHNDSEDVDACLAVLKKLKT